MKKLVMVLAIGLLAQAGWCSSLSDLVNDVTEETHLTILKSATPQFFYSLGQGKSMAGVSTEIFAYRFLSGDLGWVHEAVDSGKGSGIGGGTVHIDRLVSQYYPEVSGFLYKFVPRSMERFYQKLSVGFSGGWDFDRGAFIYGVTSGLKLDF